MVPRVLESRTVEGQSQGRPWAREHRQPLEAGEGEEKDSPQKPPEGTQPPEFPHCEGIAKDAPTRAALRKECSGESQSSLDNLLLMTWKDPKVRVFSHMGGG